VNAQFEVLFIFCFAESLVQDTAKAGPLSKCSGALQTPMHDLRHSNHSFNLAHNFHLESRNPFEHQISHLCRLVGEIQQSFFGLMSKKMAGFLPF
jgi:hypothetical protein